MSIYRGTGSASTTTDQATIDEVTTQATNAASSATSAASSASSAASSASSASSSASTATRQASAASTSASSASSSASTATTSAFNAANQATLASASATTASSHATNASTAKDAAVVAQGLAEDAQLAAETAKGLAEGFKDLAATSASSASASASTATTKAGEALASANSASDAQTAAEAAQAAAEAAQAAIDGTYLGAQASNPTGDGNGNDVTVGDWYFNTTANQAYIYNGSTWDALAPDLIGDATPQLGGELDTNGNDVSFGDNDKATFGTGDDLQIYHDGLHSVIKDAGTGYLKIGLSDQGTAIQNTAGNNLLVTDATDVSLRHNGSEVFTTTSTGIDVTGTVTADGLTVDNGGSQPVTTLVTTGTGGGTQPTFKFQRNTDSLNDNAQVGIIQWQAGTASNNVAGIYVDHVGTSENAARMEFYTSEGGNFRERMLIDNNGDISFYEDTGTTAKFVWDASAESLGINTTAPKAELHIVGPDGDAEGVPSFNADSVAIFQNNGAAGDASIVNIISGTTGNGWIVFGDKDDSIRQAIVASQSDDSLSFRTGNNSEAVHIDNVGNVGIGTSSPSGLLDVEGTAYIGPTGRQSIITESAGNDSAVIRSSSGNLELRGSGTDYFQLFLKSGGNVGIGTQSPQSELHVKGEGEILRIESTDATGDCYITFRDSSANKGYIGYGSSTHNDLSIENRETGSDIFFQVGTSEAMRITSNGGLLVGKTTSGGTTAGMAWLGNEYLQLVNTETGATDRCLLINRQSADGTLIEFRKANSQVGSIGAQGNYLFTGSSGGGYDCYLKFVSNSTQRIGACTDTGSDLDATVSLGASSVRFKDLYLSGKTHYGVAGQTYYQVVKANGDGLYIGADDGSTGGTGADIRFNIKADEKMRILNSGHVVIGRTSTASSATDYGFNFYETGQLYINSSSSGNSDVIRGYDSSGANTFAIDGDGDYINLSDQRKKENIADIQIGLAEVMQLQPRQFDWIDSGEHVPSGFVAQEVQSIIPSAVVENDDGFLMMKDRQLIPVLTKALQEAVARIETLEAEVATLKGN